MDVYTTADSAQWLRAVQQGPHDFYHLPQYHALAESMGEGRAFLFHYVEDEYSVALPLLLRPVDHVPGMTPGSSGWQDMTSVYGYAGPIASHVEIPALVLRNFQTSLQKRLTEMGVVTVFSRLHPVIPQQALLAGLGECVTLSRTVSVDLTLSPELQRSAYRSRYRTHINKLRRLGLTCVIDRDRSYLKDFAALYDETMRRVGALPAYFFPLDYFRNFADTLGEHFHLAVCLHEGRVVCGGIFIECRGILQYHLGGTIDAALQLAPMKLLIEEMRLWACGRDLQCFHLGGGATTQADDPLLYFKRGFTSREHDFAIWRWVLRDDVYQHLCAEKRHSNQRDGLASTNATFFPEYRAPTSTAGEAGDFVLADT